MFSFFFFFNDTATTEIYTLSLHDALPIYGDRKSQAHGGARQGRRHPARLHHPPGPGPQRGGRSEEHTSELQSRRDLVCRLLLEKKKKNMKGKKIKKMYKCITDEEHKRKEI